ncbi:MAG: hypothetical protein E7576_13470 [Ruminococcaceae bacterium]|jgi:F-type H+-transporting ATPase subunit b|nr:hypothetical protein [Oscillospiraceae bacterium]
MTIQLPVLLWTVICFVLLMVILNRLLFRPLLAFMDRREERIRSAAETLRKREEARRDAEEQLARFREEEAERIKRLSAESVAQAESDASALLSDAVAEQKRQIESCREALTREAEEIGSAANEKAEELAKAYLSALMGG